MPAATTERALAPDLARGLMLLLIVVSNTTFYLFAAEFGPTGWHPVSGGLIDRIAQFLMIVGLDLRVYPLFAFLFGYGMMQFYQRQTDNGLAPGRVMQMLRRRSLVLILFGFLHASLLLAGDILGAYGLMSLILGWLFLRRSDRVLVWAMAVAVVLLLLAVALQWLVLTAGQVQTNLPTTSEVYAAGEPDLVAAMKTRLETWLYVTVAGGLMGFSFHAAMLAGFWAARRRILETPHRHRALLVRVAVIGIAIGWMGGLPTALGHLRIIEMPDAALVQNGLLFMVQLTTGLAGGLGYAAAFGLLAAALGERERNSLPVTMITAVGKRSLSSYIGHSVIFSPLLAAWGLGWGSHLTSATMVLFACAVWLLIGLGCLWLEHADRRGPAEVAYRRLSSSWSTTQGNPGSANAA